MRIVAAFIFGASLGYLWSLVAHMIAGPSDAWSLLTWVLFVAISFALGAIAGKITTTVL